MTTGPSEPDQAEGGKPPNGPDTPAKGSSASSPDESEMHFMSRKGWWFIPVGLIVIGAILGWADLVDTGAESTLRILALVVALILFSQGLTDFKAGGKRSILAEVRVEVGQELLATKQRLEACSTALEKTEVALAVARGEKISKEEAAATTKPSEPPERAWLPIPGSRSAQERAVMTSVLLMGLGIWLGVELLTTEKPVSPYLLVFSMVGVFLVFYAGAKAVMTEST